MGKLLKRIALGIVALVVLVVLGIVAVLYGFFPKARPAADMKAPATPEAIARGKYLAENVMLCVTCHSPSDSSVPGQPIDPSKRGAGYPDVDPGFPGHLVFPNITVDKGTGIGAWTDGEIVRAMREGISKDGRALVPVMQYEAYAKTLSDADALAIVAYLRSLPPVQNNPGRTTVNFPFSALLRTSPEPLAKAFDGPPKDAKAYGEWVLAAARCEMCHDTFNEQHEVLRRFGGGEKFPTPAGTFVAPNISSDKEAGIGNYTDEQILAAINGAGRPLHVMPTSAYKGMTDEDKKALIGALRAVPPIK